MKLERHLRFAQDLSLAMWSMKANRIVALKAQFDRLPGIWIPILFAIILLVVSPFHSTFKEWDGVMQYFAGREIISGVGYGGWALHFWPPLYPLLMGLGDLVLPGFWARKLISLTAAVILVYIAYCLAVEITNSVKIGLLTQVFLVLNPLFFVYSLQAQDFMLNALFFAAGLLLFFTALRNPEFKRLLVVGLVCGLAGLCEYTSYVLLALPLVFFISTGFRKAALLAITFWVGFALVSLPWWYYNAISNGSPLATWQYMTIGSEVVPQEGGWRIWWWSGQSNFDNVFSILAAYPAKYLENYVQNVLRSGKLIALSAGALAPFVLPAFLESFISMKPRYWLILFGTLFLFVNQVSQSGMLDFTFLVWTTILTILSLTFVFRYMHQIQEKYPTLYKYHFTNLTIVLLVMAGFMFTFLKTSSFLSDKYFGELLIDLDAVTMALKEHDSNLETKRIMAMHPARAYYAGAKYLATPEYYEGSVEDMVSYTGISERVKTYAPKYPSNMADSDLRADYLIYTGTPEKPAPFGMQDLPQFSFLLDPESDKIPENFKRVYYSAKVVVYEIDWGDR
jgi:4-amino-4-deoxy-L-arabinose transferase-like glycosyltransferase